MDTLNNICIEKYVASYNDAPLMFHNKITLAILKKERTQHVTECKSHLPIIVSEMLDYIKISNIIPDWKEIFYKRTSEEIIEIASLIVNQISEQNTGTSLRGRIQQRHNFDLF